MAKAAKKGKGKPAAKAKPAKKAKKAKNARPVKTARTSTKTPKKPLKKAPKKAAKKAAKKVPAKATRGKGAKQASKTAKIAPKEAKALKKPAKVAAPKPAAPAASLVRERKTLPDAERLPAEAPTPVVAAVVIESGWHDGPAPEGEADELMSDIDAAEADDEDAEEFEETGPGEDWND